LADFNREKANLKHDHFGFIRLVGIRNFVMMMVVLWYVMVQSSYGRQ